MGKKSRKKKERRAAAAEAKKAAERATDEYVDQVYENKEDESRQRMKEADKIMDEMESMEEDREDSGVKAMIEEMRRLKAVVDEAERVTVPELEKMKAEFDQLMPKVVMLRYVDVQEALNNGLLTADRRAALDEELKDVEETVDAIERKFGKDKVPCATEAEKARCDHLAAIINERTYHNAYMELHAQAKTRRAAAFMNKFQDKGGFITIDRIWASGGFVHIMARNGTLTTLTIREAAIRAQSIQEMLPISHPWHRARWTQFLEEVTKVLREAQGQRMDRNDKSANLLREVYDGIDAEGNPKKVAVDDRWIHNSKKLYPMLTEDEIVAVFADTQQGLTLKQKEQLCLDMHRRRATEKGLDADALQDMSLE